MQLMPTDEVDVDIIGSAERILADYRIAYRSRQVSLLGRREVLSGRGKFGIFGAGKEIAQVAMARAWRLGDFRAGYYRDQTLLFALGIHSVQQFFAQLYAHPDAEAEPMSAGRQMNAHFASRFLDENGRWLPQTERYNITADLSPTASQMPRLVGLGYASRLYRELPELSDKKQFSDNGNEIAWGTIGNASSAEGLFWEAVNAIGVLESPVVLSIWDDGFGISVPNEFQHTKSDLAEMLSGFERTDKDRGYDIYQVKGWDYPALVQTYKLAAEKARENHIPAIVHVVEMTQPQGHSTSGSHERYKTDERMKFETDFDGVRRFRDWIVANGMATDEMLDTIEDEETERVQAARDRSWDAFVAPIVADKQFVAPMIDAVAAQSQHAAEIGVIKQKMMNPRQHYRKGIYEAIQKLLIMTRHEGLDSSELIAWRRESEGQMRAAYSSHLHSDSAEAASLVSAVPAEFSTDSKRLPGFQILNRCFDAILKRDERVVAFGEDLGHLGGVNQGFAGLQAKYGKLRVSDTGIREATIIGQAIGLALRGLRPIAEIQYLDYLLYALQIIADDLATLHWRTAGSQKAPVIIRTRGHRLEGIWHTGSLMAGIIHLVRGVHVLVPRNMVQAAGFYNTLLAGDDPGIVVEVLNGYRLREQAPDNIGDYRVPIGVPEIIRTGSDVTLVTYGATCRIVMDAALQLAQVGIEVEVIDVRSLLPFDRHAMILESLKKTNRIVCIDEDVPGGTSAYMMQEIIEKQGGYHWLDSEPRTISAQEHRASFGTDGGYFSKSNAEDVFKIVYELMAEADPARYPIFY